ncbi:unnamed protein product [Chrysoparadoxa australica]
MHQGGLGQPGIELKVCIVGDSDVGKTSLCMRFIHGQVGNVNPTIGASFLQKRVVVEEDGVGQEVVLQLWDTAGQERFRSMAPMYYRHAKGALIVFDQTKGCTAEKLKRWRADLLQYAEPGVVIGVVGNKCDRAASLRQPLTEALEFAQEIGAPFLETSAYSGVGVDEVFAQVAKDALKLYRTTAAREAAAKVDRLRLEAAKQESSMCC